MDGAGGRVGIKMETTVFEQQWKKLNNVFGVYKEEKYMTRITGMGGR